MNRGRILYLGGVAIFALLMFAMFYVANSSPKANARLPDGSIVVLERVALGKSSASQNRGLSFNTFRNIIASLLSRPTFRLSAKEGSLVFWISNRDSESSAYLDFDWLSRAVVVDEHGCQFESTNHRVEADRWSGGGQSFPNAPPGSKYILASGEFETFPRRSAELILRIYDRKNNVVAELPFRNPVKGPFPEWTSDTLPSSNSVDNITITLMAATNRVEVITKDGFQVEKLSLIPRFQIYDNGISTDSWVPSQTRIEDATGNKTTATGYSLCTNEPAWKMETSFYREISSQFNSNEQWTLQSVPIPVAGDAKVLDFTNVIQGVEIRLCALSGAGSVTYSNGIPVSVKVADFKGSGGSISLSSRHSGGRSHSEITAKTGKPQVVVRINGLAGDQRFDFWAMDNKGNQSGSRQGSAGNYQIFALNYPETTRTVDLHFVVQKKRVVDFLLQPPPHPPSDNRLSPGEKKRIASAIPNRDERAEPRMIDLTPHYTATLANSERLSAKGPVKNGSASKSYSLSSLPVGIQSLDGIGFDVRGSVQLGGLALKQRGHRFPLQVDGIHIGLTCGTIHFLHGAIWTMPDETVIGYYELEYADGQKLELPIVYGNDVRDWHLSRNEDSETTQASIAWPTTDSAGGVLQWDSVQEAMG